MSDYVELLLRQMEEARRTCIDDMPLLFLRNPTPTRKRLARAIALAPKITRYRKGPRYGVSNKG